MALTDIISPARVKVALSADGKRDLIEQLVDALVADGSATDRAAVLQAVCDREATRTTGIGEGVAIPHGKCDAVDSLLLVITTLERPVDFESVDGQPIDIAFLLVSPVSLTGPHIQALARIARLLGNALFRNRLLQADTPEEVCSLIRREEDHL
ncbi:MAG: PTS sugar transporter subunit IIA [Phycisphaerae bacterium]